MSQADASRTATCEDDRKVGRVHVHLSFDSTRDKDKVGGSCAVAGNLNGDFDTLLGGTAGNGSGMHIAVGKAQHQANHTNRDPGRLATGHHFAFTGLLPRTGSTLAERMTGGVFSWYHLS